MVVVCAAISALLLLSACTETPGDGGTPPSDNVTLSLVEEDHGWVQVQIGGVTATGYRLLWGDVGTSYGITDVLPGQELYVHFYQANEGEASGEQIPTQYGIQLVNSQGIPVATLSVYVAVSDCYLQLVSLDQRTATVQYWGRFGIEYSISWGDRFADHVQVDLNTGSGFATHTYGAPGSYSLGMEEIWGQSRIFFEITVP